MKITELNVIKKKEDMATEKQPRNYLYIQLESLCS